MKTLTIFNSLYHVPQIGLGHGPTVWVWDKRSWREVYETHSLYPHNPEPSRIWSYDDPRYVYIPGRTDFAYLEIQNLKYTYHELTDKNRRSNPVYKPPVNPPIEAWHEIEEYELLSSSLKQAEWEYHARALCFEAILRSLGYNTSFKVEREGVKIRVTTSATLLNEAPVLDVYDTKGNRMERK